jgi:hypothetical protein
VSKLLPLRRIERRSTVGGMVDGWGTAIARPIDAWGGIGLV